MIKFTSAGSEDTLTYWGLVTPYGDKVLVTSHVMPCHQFVAKPLHAGLGSIQFQNWNCSSIAIPELELELKLVELKILGLELQTI